MAYYIIKNYSKSGKIGISDKVFEEIARQVFDDVKDASMYKSNKILYKPKAVSISRNNNDLKVNTIVQVNYGVKVEDVCGEIQEKIKSTIYNMTELEPTAVNVKVEKISRN